MGRKTLSGLFGAAFVMATSFPAAALPTTYSLLTTIAVPPSSINPNPSGNFSVFDITTFDATSRLAYIADRSNGTVDVFSGATNSFAGRVGGFVGQQSSNDVSGPDGVLTINSGGAHTLFAGDGNSTLKIFSLAAPTAPALTATVNTGGTSRTDELAYSPTANLVLAINNADAPAFGTLVNATTGAITASHIVLPGALPGDGLEQPVWDPVTGSFLVSIPQIGGTGPGGIAEIKTDGTVGRIFNLSSYNIGACGPTGLAVGAGGNVLLGCSAPGSQAVLFNPTGSGSVVATVTGLGGTDEVYFDLNLNDFFLTSIGANGVSLDVISAATDTLVQSIGDLPLAHSLAVDPVSGDIFVPFAASNPAFANAICPGGCVAVYAQTVPEPGALPLLALAAGVTIAAGGIRARRG